MKNSDIANILTTVSRYIEVIVTVMVPDFPKRSMWYTLKNVKSNTNNIKRRKTMRNALTGIILVLVGELDRDIHMHDVSPIVLVGFFEEDRVGEETVRLPLQRFLRLRL